MEYFFSVFLAILCCGCGFFITYNIFKSKEKPLSQKQSIILTAAASVISLSAAIFFPMLVSFDDMNPFQMLRALSLLYFLIFIGFADFKFMIIPNKMLLIMLVLGIASYAAECIVYSSEIAAIATSALLGLAICFIIFYIGKLISRKGMGMGDIKLAAIIGFFMGLDMAIGILFWTMILSALTGIVLIIAKKAKGKTKIPLAPFFFLGTIVSYILYAINA